MNLGLMVINFQCGNVQLSRQISCDQCTGSGLLVLVRTVSHTQVHDAVTIPSYPVQIEPKNASNANQSEPSINSHQPIMNGERGESLYYSKLTGM